MNGAIAFEVNGAPVSVRVAPTDRLVDVLRGPLGLTGTKEGCGNGECGACTVLVDGLAVNACLFPAPEVEGKRVTTVEGLTGAGGELSPVQQAFVDHCGIQCGFCTPGMIMATQALLDEHPDPTHEQILEGLRGNLCRCTGYVQIIESVEAAAGALASRAGEGGQNG